MSEIILTVEGVDPVELFGENNIKLNLLRKAFPEITITSRGSSVKLAGEKKFTQRAKSKFELMVRLLREYNELPVQMVEDLLGGNIEGRRYLIQAGDSQFDFTPFYFRIPGCAQPKICGQLVAGHVPKFAKLANIGKHFPNFLLNAVFL